MSRPSRGAARLAAILDALPDALLLVNCNGTVVNANAIALETFEAPGTALVGRGLLDLLPEFDSKRIPGSMRRPDEDAQLHDRRQRPTRMVARRTDGNEFPVEVTSANLEDGRTPYASSVDAAFGDHTGGTGGGYTGDELLMLVVRDLTGTLDTEAELARQQRQTEMILRAASEGVVGVDTEGRVVLVNPAAAQILGRRAGELGGKELHPLVHHSRPDGSPLAYEDTPLADTLRSGRKHRLRAGQVLWAKDGGAVPVDMTTAPVRDGEQLVGAVLTFTDRRQYEALEKRHKERYEELETRSREEYASLASRHEQLRAVLGDALRGPLDQLRDELTGLASDPAGQLWPEANQILHHLAAGYARMTTLVDNVLGYQLLDTGQDTLRRERAALDAVVASGVEGAQELIGPGRAQFAVHAPPLEAEVDAARLSTALAHLIADVAGVDATGNAPVAAAPGVDPTIVVAAAQRGEVVRIEVRGPYGGGSPVHEPLVRGIVRQHGGVLQTHEVPGSGGGSAYVLEVPVTADAASGDAAEADVPAAVTADGTGTDGTGTDGAGTHSTGTYDTGTDGTGAHGAGDTAGGNAPGAGAETTMMPVPAQPVRGTGTPADADASGEGTSGADAGVGAWTGTDAGPGADAAGGTAAGTDAAAPQDRPTGRRRGRPSPVEEQQEQAAASGAPGGALELPSGTGQGAAGESGPGSGAVVPPQGTGRRARRALASPTGEQAEAEAPETGAPGAQPELPALPAASSDSAPTGGGRRARRLARAHARTDTQDTGPAQAQAQAEAPGNRQQADPQGVQFAAPPAQHRPAHAHPEPAQPHHGRAPGQPAPEQEAAGPYALPPGNGAGEPPAQPALAAGAEPGTPAPPANGTAPGGTAPGAELEPQPRAAEHSVVAASPILGGGPLPEQRQPQRRPALGRNGDSPDPGYENEQHGQNGQGPRVRTLGQGVPFTQQIGEQSGSGSYGRAALPAPAPPTSIPSTPSTPAQQPGPGRRRKLASPQREEQPPASQNGRPGGPGRPGPMPPTQGGPAGQGTQGGRAQAAAPAREFSIGAPDAGGPEGPEPLDGPDSPVEVSDGRGLTMPLRAVDDELPPEPLDNPRRLLVWPEPDASTQQALSERGYRPVIVHSREEVDAQIAAYPAALFVDPLTGPITRTALQSLRTAAVAAEVPVLVTAGLGQATREAAYGADPAVLLKALAPRDSEQHPPRVLLVEEHEAIASALAASLERRGMQVAHAPTDAEAVNVAAQARPNLVVMDLMQVRRRRAGIIDWLRVNGVLNRTPFVVYTSADMDPGELPRLASGETVLFLAERSTSGEVQSRIVDLLTKIGAN